MECTAPSARVEVAQRRHGGSILPHQWPQGVTYEPIVLRAGRTDDVSIYNWFSDCLRVAGGIGGASDGHERDVTIEELGRETGDGNAGRAVVVERIRVWGAFVTEYSPGAYDNASNEYLVESVTIAYRYFERLTPRTNGDAGLLTTGGTPIGRVGHQGTRLL